ncbi:hypothetical protein M0R45_020880 [Rubus argutus]|uniref:Uncharacterized protein n=1 Tax=Rubus argutus TaxID=59490 RepID=A0AAW1XBB1_RUBAR
MGCGESKAAVDTSNTILRRKKSNAVDSSKKSKDIGTIPETTTDCDSSVANSTRQQQEAAAASSSGEQVVVNKNSADVVVADDVNDINENKKENGEGQRNNRQRRQQDEEGIDGIISEGRSGTSDYYTPRHKANLFFKVEEESNAVEEDKELLPAAQETKPADQDQTTPSTENKGEPVILVEESMVKEPAEVEIKNHYC